jgi:hypothetical protein
MSANTFLLRRTQFFVFLTVANLLRPLVYSAAVENKETFQNGVFMPVKPFALATGPLKLCDIPWSGVSMRALILGKVILSICSEA